MPRISKRIGRWLLAAGAAGGAVALLRARRDARLPSWRGRVALVTGGTRGFGLLLARELAAEGCSLVLCARDPEELRRAALELRQRGAAVLTVPCDVTDEAQVEHMVSRAIERFHRLDILVNNAGQISVGPLESTTMEDFHQARRVIFDGAVHCTLAALPHLLRQRDSHVLNVSSIGGRVAMPHMLPYDCAKFALTGFSEGLRAELAGHGVRVTTIFPGTMRTGSYRHARFKGRREQEYIWFALAASLPVLSMSPGRAARAAVRAARRGQAEVVVPLYAKLFTLLHGIAPSAAGAVLSGIARLLPAPPPASEGPDGEALGSEIEERLSRRRRWWLERLTVLGRSDGRRARPEEGSAIRIREPTPARQGAAALLAGALLCLALRGKEPARR